MTDGCKEPIDRADAEGACFSELFDRFWDSTVDDGATQRQVASIERHLRLSPGARVVVAPSHCGRLALALAARGFAVVGIDRSSDAIDRSMALATQVRSSAEFRYSGELSLDHAGACDGAVCIGHGAASDTLAAGLGAILKPGARALIEVDRGEPLQAMSQALAAAGFEAVDECCGLNDDQYVASARSLICCARA